jgi:hypothetical protein
MVIVKRWHGVKEAACGATIENGRDLALNRMLAFDLPDFLLL